MKDKLLKVFLSFVRKTFTKERLLDFIDDLLDIVYDRFARPDRSVDERIIDQTDTCNYFKEAMDKDV